MKNYEVKDILIKNNDDKLNIYLNILLSKCKDIAIESNLIAIIMLILILLFYLTDFAKADSLQIGPLSIKDINSVKVFIPLVFSFLILRYFIISSHKAELHKIIKEFSKNHFCFETSENIFFIDDFTRSLLPISIYDEIGKLNYKDKSKLGCIGALLIFPISGLAFTPFIFEFIWIKKYIYEFNTLNLMQKSSVILSIWILLISVYYFFHTMKIEIKENKNQ